MQLKGGIVMFNSTNGSTSSNANTASSQALSKALKYIDPAVEKRNRLESISHLAKWYAGQMDKIHLNICTLVCNNL